MLCMPCHAWSRGVHTYRPQCTYNCAAHNVNLLTDVLLNAVFRCSATSLRRRAPDDAEEDALHDSGVTFVDVPLVKGEDQNNRQGEPLNSMFTLVCSDLLVDRPPVCFDSALVHNISAERDQPCEREAVGSNALLHHGFCIMFARPHLSLPHPDGISPSAITLRRLQWGLDGYCLP